MKINYISIFDPTLHFGGGEAVASDLIKAGQARGHEFSMTTVRPKGRIEFDESADLDFLVDVFNHPTSLKSLGIWKDFPAGLLRRVISRNRFTHLTNAYADICNLGYLPCSGQSNHRCNQKSPFNLIRNIAAKDFSVSCFSNDLMVKSLFTNALLNIFVSPLHRDVSLKVLNLKHLSNNFVLKPTVDSNLFFDRGLKRDIEYLFVGIIGEAKGLRELKRLYANKDMHFVGKIHPGERLDFGTYHGPVSYDQIPIFMNRAKNFVFLPRWPEPQGRVVIEAALCGCNLIVNENVGATSFPFEIRDPSNFQNAAQELWQVIEGLR